ncbi:MAG TPA: chromosome segregation protein SMC, partial [Candidatus Latescibacteria bacterium]|nr:chromosome segregation protein SMC [Candidatus Latescibacterota bacterium]
MIPVRLSLKNFLSYGEEVPPLDFTPLHVVCLSGDNGHGKSALLDAMTWAIWGEARKAAGDRKPDERLLRMGATDMAVEFEFDLEGDRYRILRQYRAGR